MFPNKIDLFQNHFKAALPELFFITAITIILLYGVIYNPSAYYKFPILTNAIGWLGIQTLFIATLLVANGASSNIGIWGGATEILFGNVLILDDFALLCKTIILLSALSSILIASDYIKGQKINSFEYIILILFSTLAMTLVVSSYDLISMYLAIELQSLSFYVIAAFQRNDEFSTEAGLKYFILGALSSGLLLVGESIVYGFTGITNFEELPTLLASGPLTFPLLSEMAQPEAYSAIEPISSLRGGEPDASSPIWVMANMFPYENGVRMGLLFMLVAFLFKIGAVPFHMWTPDVYEGAPTSVTAFFAITPKIAIFGLLSRLCLHTFYDLIASWQQIILVCALLSMFIGTWGAINQNKIKRLFAYSSIAHVGYLLIGLGTGTIAATESLLVYLIVYVSMAIGIFGIILVLTQVGENRDNFMIPSNSQSFLNNWRARGTAVPGLGVLPDISSPKGPNLGSKIYKSFPLSELDSEPRPASPLHTKDDPRDCGPVRIFQGGNPLGNAYSSGDRAAQSTEVDFRAGAFGRGAHALTRRIPQTKQICAKRITDLNSLSETNPILAFTAAIIFFSNAGVPPLAGFYGKLNIFLAAVEESMYFIALAGVLCSVMGAFYSIRLVKILYFHSMTKRTWIWYKTMSKASSIVLAFTFFFTLLFFLYPSFLFSITHAAALGLCI